jgi:ubiquinone/menaquinone biosynthesis C-methylase UbiE
VGSVTREHWIEVGKLQFDYLIKHGLQPHHRVLDIGCGNLRAGWRMIHYLDSGNYYGVDISPEILLAALTEVQNRKLQHKFPHLVLVSNLSLDFLPGESFDVMHAHSVFTHTRADIVDQCFASAARVLRPSGFFDFTYFQGETFSFADEDFSYPTALLVEMAASHHLEATSMSDWEYSQHKLRLKRRCNR